MEDRRRFERTATSIRVVISHPSFGSIVGFTRDLSDGGAQVCFENSPIPPVGTVVDVVFTRVAGPVNAQPVRMRIMHCHRNIAGLMFVSP